jgi:hypothetical protein
MASGCDKPYFIIRDSTGAPSPLQIAALRFCPRNGRSFTDALVLSHPP